jgi:hypothetical protein
VTGATIGLADDTVYQYKVRFVARRQDAAGRATYVRWVLAYREGGGGATIAAFATPWSANSNMISSITIDTNGNDLRFRVAGSTGQTANWNIEWYDPTIAT